MDLIWIAADEVVTGDRIVVPSLPLGELATVLDVEPNLDVPGNLLIQFDGGTYEVGYETQISAAPNPAIGEV